MGKAEEKCEDCIAIIRYLNTTLEDIHASLDPRSIVPRQAAEDSREKARAALAFIKKTGVLT